MTTLLNHINPWDQTSQYFVRVINKLKYSSVTLMKQNKPWALFSMILPNHYNVNFSTLHFSFLLPFLFEYGIIGNEVAIFRNTSLKHNNARKCQTKRKSFLWPCLNIFSCYTNVIIFIISIGLDLKPTFHIPIYTWVLMGIQLEHVQSW